MKTQKALIATLSLTALGLSACLETSQAEDPPVDPPPSGLHVLHQDVSECGGFGVSLYDEPTTDGYCDAEVLAWAYDAETATLSLSNERVLLNCCGERTLDLSFDGGTYVLTERDAPVDGDGRCNCLCVFDLELSAAGVPAEPVDLRIVRDESDDGTGARVVWEGRLDLTTGAGREVVETSDASPWCEADEPASSVSQTPRVSECGGFARAPSFDDAPQPPADDYCGAERLTWTYDAAARALTLRDDRVELNCCGDREISAELVDGVVVVTETDAPEGGDARCFCTCVFDFELTLDEIVGEALPLRLVRHVTDAEGGPTLLFDGVLDLSAGGGAEILDDAPATYCE